ncbi:MAG: TRAP transporter large permease [Spirochaetaceae bacterium]
MADHTVATYLLIGSFLVLIVLKLPITFALAVSTVATAFYLDVSLMSIVQRMASGVRIFSLLAIPFFILAGELMSKGGIATRLIKFSNLIIGRVRGGLGLVNVLASMFFGGISGSAVADVSSIGSIMIPVMKKKGYDADYSTAITITSACQGIVIPPSHNVIIYSLAAGGLSVGALFLAGIVPGILLGLVLMVLAYWLAVRRGYPAEAGYTWQEAKTITKDAFFGLLTPVIIIGGVISGVFTATESAAIACIYAFLVSTLIYREMSFRRLWNILYSTLRTLAMVLSLIAMANAFGWLLALLRVPALVTEGLLTLSESPVVLLLLINLMLLLLGMIMDMAPLIVITTPILFPVVVHEIGMSPIQFGIVMMLNLGIGLATPPVGTALFVGTAVGGTTIEKATKAMLPMYAAMIVVLLMVTFMPFLSMTIPGWFMG